MIVPGDERLLRGVREIVGRLSGSLTGRNELEALRVIDIVLQELLKRQDVEFHAKAFASGRELALWGLRLLPANSSPADTAAIRNQIEGLPESIALTSNSTTYGDLLQRLRRILAALVGKLSASPQSVASDFLRRATEWEVALVQPWPPADATASGKGERPAAPNSSAAERLQDYLRRRFPDSPDVEVTRYEPLPGGYSKLTTLFETRSARGGEQSLVMRAEMPVTPFHMDGANIVNEFYALRTAFKGGVPVAEPLWVEDDPTQLGARFLVSRRAAGRNLGDVLGSAEPLSERTIRSLVATLARIHNVRLDREDPELRRSHLHKWSQYRTLTEFTPAWVNYWRDIWRKCGEAPSPALARGFEWLLANAPRCDEAPVLVHGDFGLHNTMIGDEKVEAVLDWEASHVGDPADEFFLFSLVMSAHVKPDVLMQWYREAGGKQISDYRLKYFKVLNCLKGPIVGYGALRLVAEHPELDLKNISIGLLYVHTPMSFLEPLIADAEAARTPEDR